ncbi:fukutin isoform X2 [Brachionus plicatilis]|uniref:Fukutin isoform X2 n=1 Tax=Brachionus plicatilis TaxID=10195 RepID=A0A3M7PAI3_BRAPC|nr:fukutin isoform X2 [Brachionus plicatilis]
MRRFLSNLYKKRSFYIIMMGFYMFQWNLYIYHIKLDDSPLSVSLNEYEKSIHLDHFNFVSFLTELFSPELTDIISNYSTKYPSINVTSSTIFHLNNILAKNNVYLLDVGVLIQLKKELGNSLETDTLVLADFLKYSEQSLVSYGINLQDTINFLEDLKSAENLNCQIMPVFSEFFAQKILASIYVKCALLTLHVVVIYQRGNFLWMPKDEFEVDGLLKFFGDKPRAFNKFESMEIIDREFQTAKIPKNIDKFLFDYKHSEFVECSLTKPFKNYSNDRGSKYQFDRNKEISISQKLVYVKSVLESFLKDYSISGFILNGWLNDCEINPSMKQVDLVLNGFDFDPQMLKHLSHDKKLPFSQINFDNQTLNIEMSKLGDISLSLSFSYEYNKTHRWLHRNVGTHIIKKFVRNFEPICSAELMSAKILIPCDPVKYLNHQKVNTTKSFIKKLVEN